MTDRLKLRTNVAMFGVAQYANYWKGKDHTDEKGQTKRLPDQLELKGRWGEDPAQLADDRLFLPIPLLGVMLEIGLLRQESGVDNYGNPRYSVLDQHRQLRVIKVEDAKDAKKKRTYLGWADAGHPETAAAAPATAKSAPTKAPSEPPGRAPASTGHTSGPPPLQEPAGQSPKTVVTRAMSDEEKLAKIRRAHRRRLMEIAETSGCAWAAAAREIDRFLTDRQIERGKIPTSVYLDLVARMAAHVAIQAEHEDLTVVRSEKKADGGSPSKGSPHGAGTGAQGVQDHGPPPVQPISPIVTDETRVVGGVGYPKAKGELALDPFSEELEESDLPY